MTLLRVPDPYSFELSTGRFRAFGLDRANVWHEGALYRVAGDREVRVAPAEGGVDVEPLDDETEPVVRRLLGLDFDLDGFGRFAARDPVLGELAVRLRGLRPPLAPDPFESLVTSITAQQVSLRSAFAVRGRLIERYGGYRGAHAIAFPTREALAGAGEDDLTRLGFSRRKAGYVIALARSDLDLDRLTALPDDDVKGRLVALPGIGEWTADWFLARYLARPRAWPAGDLGLRKAASRFYGGGRDLTTEEVRALGARFEPFQNLAAHYLLAGLLTGP